MSQNLAYSPSPRAYREGAILSAPPERFVVMLYDGARRFLHQASAAMRAEQIELTHNKLRRAEDIIIYLKDTLDLEKGGEIAVRLQAIYLFCGQHLRQMEQVVRHERGVAVGEVVLRAAGTGVEV